MANKTWLGPNQGGVCDKCGCPRFAHNDEICPTAEEIVTLEDQITQWKRIVNPDRALRKRFTKRATDLRRDDKQGLASAAQIAACAEVIDAMTRLVAASITTADELASNPKGPFAATAPPSEAPSSETPSSSEAASEPAPTDETAN